MNKSPMTVRGAKRLREELDRLKTVVRPKITKAIAEARAHGDLKENAEYHAAREEQSLAEARIADIEGKLSIAEIIDVRNLDVGGKIVFGATVVLAKIDTGDEVSYRIVGEDEADIKEGMISVISPIARALIGKEEGASVSVAAPSGEVEYEVLEVKYV